MSRFRKSPYETSKPIQLMEDVPPFWIISDHAGKAIAVFESTFDAMCFCKEDERILNELDLPYEYGLFAGVPIISFGETQELNAFDLGYLQ